MAAAWTSDFTIRPPGPEPVSPDSSTPSSAAIRRAIGDALTRPLPSPAGWSTCSSAVATGASSSDCSDSGALSSAVGTSERSGGGASSAGSSSAAASSAAGSCSPPASSAGFEEPPPIVAIVSPTASVSPSLATIWSAPASSAS